MIIIIKVLIYNNSNIIKNKKHILRNIKIYLYYFIYIYILTKILNEKFENNLYIKKKYDLNIKKIFDIYIYIYIFFI